MRFEPVIRWLSLDSCIARCQRIRVMSEFYPVAITTAIPDPGSALVEVADRLIVLIHAAGHWYALDDVCTHDGGTLSDGEILGNCIVCPRHGAKFDYRTGAAVTMPATVPTVAHTVSIRGDEVYVKLNDF